MVGPTAHQTASPQTGVPSDESLGTLIASFNTYDEKIH